MPLVDSEPFEDTVLRMHKSVILVFYSFAFHGELAMLYQNVRDEAAGNCIYVVAAHVDKMECTTYHKSGTAYEEKPHMYLYFNNVFYSLISIGCNQVHLLNRYEKITSIDAVLVKVIELKKQQCQVVEMM